MAIGTNDGIEKFGTADDLDSSSAAVANGSFSVAGDLAQWTNDDDAPYASAVFVGTYTVAPDVNSTVDLFARLMNINGVSDAEVPDANNEHYSLGSFPLNDVTTEQNAAIEIKLPNVYTAQLYEFYIRNNGGQTLSAGWKIVLTPKAIGPHA